MIPAWVKGALTPVEKLETHRRGLKHKAVSVFLFAGGKLLIQQRAQGKYHSGGLWANTCCTHPLWGEDDADCAARRLAEELGITAPLPLVPRGRLTYRADVGGGLVEHEDVAVFTAHLDAAPDMQPNPDEVAATDWVTLDDLEAQIGAEPARFTPWLRIYLAEHRDTVTGR